MPFQDTRIKHRLSAAVKRWLAEETEEQNARHKKIAAEMDALAETRHKWYEAFLRRIQTRGFNADGDLLVKVPASDIPVKPKNRKDRVVW